MITREAFWDVVLVYLLLFVSGTMLFREASQQYLILTFVITVIAWALRTDQKIADRFLLYATIFTGFLLTIHLYTDGSLSLGTVIGSALELALAYLIVKTVGKRFTETYIKVVVFLAGVSLFGYLTDQFHLFDSVIRKLPQVGNNGYEGILYLYRYHYAGYGRNNSIFFEPGAYQGFLNAALFILFFVKTEFGASRRWVYILVLLATLYTTFSTTGYLMFAIMFGLFLFKSEVLSTSSKAVLVGVVLAVLVIFSAKFHHVIVNKIDRYTSIEDITDKGHRRSFDALVDLQIFKRHVFGVGYEKYWQEFGVIGVVSEGSARRSSNGVTSTLAIYGLPFALFLFASYYWAIWKLLGEVFKSIVAFGLLLMFLYGEAYYVLVPFPLVLIAGAFEYRRFLDDEGIETESEVAPQ